MKKHRSSKIYSDNKLTKKFLIEEYTKNKKSSNKIAKLVGCSNVTILNYMEKYKIIKRTASEAYKLTNNFKAKNKVNCFYCNKVLEVIPSRTLRTKYFFCNREHYGLWCSKYKRNENGTNYKGLKIKYCEVCGKELSESSKYNKPKCCRSCAHEGRITSEKTKRKISATLKNKHLVGELSSVWKGGSSKLAYTFEFNKQLKTQIRFRDNYICQFCGISENEQLFVYGSVLSIHHIDYNKGNNSSANLISLCTHCHQKTNGSREYWKNFYQKKIGVIYGSV